MDDDGQYDGDGPNVGALYGTSYFEDLKRRQDPFGQQKIGEPPWHMWGTHVSLTSNASVDPDDVAKPVTQQVARIDYRRPETWSFFIGAGLTGGNVNATGVDLNVELHVDLIIGVGRSVFLTDQRAQGTATVQANQVAFAQFDWVVPNGVIPGQQLTSGNLQNWKYTTEVQSPALSDALQGAGIDSRRLISWLPAANIQAQFRMIKLAGGPGQTVTLECHCYFAPRTHVRPDWFSKNPRIPQFAGDETRGK